MTGDIDILAEIPCFKCLFWEWKKESHLYCNPNECQALTDWLLEEAEKCTQSKDNITILASIRTDAHEKPTEQT